MGQNCKPYMVLWYLLSIHSSSNPNADILVTSLVLKHCAHALHQPRGCYFNCGLWLFGMGLSATSRTSRLHTSAFTAMMRSPMAFFNHTPVGKTLNVFAKDFDTIDDVLHDNFYQFWILIYTFYDLISIVVIFAWIMIGILILFAIVFYFYLINAAIIKMHLGSSTSTVVSHTAETLTGLSVERAFNKENKFLEANQA